MGPDGKDVELKPLPPPRRVLDEAESYVVTSMLGSVIDHGTGVRARELHRPLAGKTGTSNQSKDTWFSRAHPDAAHKTIADLLGHLSINTTARYARVHLQELREAALPWPR